MDNQERRIKKDDSISAVVYRDKRFTLYKKDNSPCLIADGKKLILSCHPYEPCLYITDENGFLTAVHNAFDPYIVLDSFRKGNTVTSITGFEYDAEDFCKMAAYAAGKGDISISDAEKVFAYLSAKKSSGCCIITDDSFFRVMEEYPDSVIDYCIVNGEMSYCGYESHKYALDTACSRIFAADDEELNYQYDTSMAHGMKISPDEFFASCSKNEELNYRKAFLYPPYGNNYTDSDFERVNGALFPKGKSGLEIYKWTTDWSEYFDDGNEWWGTLCVTVYDKNLDRFAVILASATD